MLVHFANIRRSRQEEQSIGLIECPIQPRHALFGELEQDHYIPTHLFQRTIQDRE